MISALQEMCGEGGVWDEMFQALPCLAAVVDLNQHIVRMNQALADQLGISPADAIGKPCYELIHGTSEPPEQCPCGSLLKDGLQHEITLDEPHLNGTYHVCVSPLRVDGEVAGCIHIMRNVSTEAQTAKALRESEEKYRILVENQTDMIVKIDVEGRFLFASPAYCRVFGKPEHELLGEKFMPLVHEDDRAHTEEEMKKLFKPPHSAYIEQRAMTAYGWRWLAWSDTAILDDEGEIIAIVGVGRDITEHRKRDDELRESEEKYRDLFNSTVNGIALHEIILDSAGVPCNYRYLDANPAFEQLTGIPRKSVIGHKVLDVLPELEPYWIEEFGKVALTGKSIEYENYVRELDKYFEVNVYSPRHGQFAVVFADTTARKKAEQAIIKARDAAEDASRTKSRFLANMSHELRTPLNGVIGMIDLMLVSPLTDEQREYAEIISTSSAMLLSIITDLLDIAKIEMGKLELKEAPFSSHALFEKAIQVVNGLAESKLVELNVSIDDEIPDQVIGDEERLQQVLVNLLNNAIKFTPSGSVRLTATCLANSSEGCRLRISVQDTGVGVEKEALSRIFLPFQQADDTVTREYGGTGLGLSICKSYIELMGGTISVKSKKDYGSTFTFDLLLKK